MQTSGQMLAHLNANERTTRPTCGVSELLTELAVSPAEARELSQRNIPQSLAVAQVRCNTEARSECRVPPSFPCSQESLRRHDGRVHMSKSQPLRRSGFYCPSLHLGRTPARVLAEGNPVDHMTGLGEKLSELSPLQIGRRSGATGRPLGVTRRNPQSPQSWRKNHGVDLP